MYWNMFRKRRKMRSASLRGGRPIWNARSIAGRAITARGQDRRNPPVRKMVSRNPFFMRSIAGTMKAAHNLSEERDHDFAHSFRPPSCRLQGKSLGSGALRQSLHGVRVRDGQTTRPDLAGERAAGLRRFASAARPDGSALFVVRHDRQEQCPIPPISERLKRGEW